jgi:hypothetical protein
MMAGRKRKAGVVRQPGGRVDHSSNRARREKAEDMRQVALEARTNVLGVPRHLTAAMPETTFLGLLCAQQAISERQMNAARRLRAIREEYDRLHPIKGFPHSSVFDHVGGHDDSEESYVRRFERAADWHMRADVALWKANRVDHRARSAVEHIVLDEWEQPHLVEPLIIGLDHLIVGLDIP